MKNKLCALLYVLLLLTTSGCGIRNVSKSTPAEDRIAANIWAGAAKVVKVGDYIYMSRKDAIVRFDPQKNRNIDAAEYIFKSGRYDDICYLNGTLYSIKRDDADTAEIVSIDLGSGKEQVIKKYTGDEANEVWFATVIKGKLYIWDNKSIYTLDSNNDLTDTGYRDPLFITEDGIYIKAATKDDVNKGLKFVPDKKGKVVEYPELKDNNVDIKFRYGSRLYIAVDNKPAYIEHGGSKTVTFIKGTSAIKNIENAIYIGLNYIDSPDKTLVCTVGLMDSEGKIYSDIYLIDVEAETATLIYTKTSSVFPLCWPSVIDEEIFIGGIGETTEWITAH